MKKSLTQGGCVVLILICMAALYPAHFIITALEDETQGQIYSDYYLFDPGIIFTKYKDGKQDLFYTIPLDDVTADKLENLPVYPSSNWKQQDYLDLLDIFQENIYHESFPKKVRKAMFSIHDCSQATLGPQDAMFFTADINPGSVTYYSYSVSPHEGTVYYHGNSYEPILSWPVSFLDLSKYRITAEEALHIAEENDGRQVRLANQNQCEIDVSTDSKHRPGKWIVNYRSTTDQFTSLLSMEIDATTGRNTVIADGGAGYYTFEPKNILESIATGEEGAFKAQKIKPERYPILPPVSWTQEDYYRIAKAFNRAVLGQDLDEWKIHSISFELNCDDANSGLQQIHFTFWRINPFKKDYFFQDVIINPRTGVLEWSHEYDYDVSRLLLIDRSRNTIDRSWIKVPANEALQIAYEAEGKGLHQSLQNSGKACQISGWLDNTFNSKNPDSLAWDILEWKRDYQLLGEQDSQLRSFVNIETGELKFFKFY